MLPVVAKQIRNEMKNICSPKVYSILRDKHEALKCFSWETLWSEFMQGVPSLVKLLQLVLPKASNCKAFLCFVISILLKKRCMHMCLMQRMVSILFYGNGAHKQVRTLFFITIPK